MTVFVPESIKVLGSDAGGASVVLCDMFVDDLADLPAPDAYNGYKLSMGCTATVINDNSRHRINSAGQWVQIAAGTSTYTREEIDSMIARIDATSSEDRAALIAQVDGGAKNLAVPLDLPARSDLTITNNKGQYTIIGTTTSAFTGYLFRPAAPLRITTDCVIIGAEKLTGLSYNVAYRNSAGSGLKFESIGTKKILPSGAVMSYIYVQQNTIGTAVSANINLMLCTAADWAISQKFVPYAPTNAELYEMIKSYHP